MRTSLQPIVYQRLSYDYANSDTDPTQPSQCTQYEIDNESCGGHGTSIGGVIAAVGWNNKGVRGIAPEASIFWCKSSC